MRIFAFAVAIGLVLACLLWVAYGIMLGVGKIGAAVEPSNRILSIAVPSLGVSVVVAGVLVFLGMRAKK